MAAKKKKDVSNQRAENQRLNASNPDKKKTKTKPRTTRLNKEASYRKSLVQRYSTVYGSSDYSGDAVDQDGAVMLGFFNSYGTPRFAGRMEQNFYPKGPYLDGINRSPYEVDRTRKEGLTNDPWTGSSYGFDRTPIEAAMANVAFRKGVDEQKALGPAGRFSLPSGGPIGIYSTLSASRTGLSGGSAKNPYSNASAMAPQYRSSTTTSAEDKAAADAYRAEQALRLVREAEAKVKARRRGPESTSYTATKKKTTTKKGTR